MQDYRRLLLVAILAWSASAVVVHAQDDGSSVAPCNAFCRFWLGRDASQKETPPPPAPPAATAETQPPAEGGPQPEEPEALPRMLMKGKGIKRAAGAPPAMQQPAIQQPAAAVEEGQGAQPDARGASSAPATAASQPMDLTPEEAAAAAEPPVQERPVPLPPRPLRRSRQARTDRPKLPLMPGQQPLPGAVRTAASRPTSTDVVETGTTATTSEPARRAVPAVKPPSARPVAGAPASAPRHPVLAAAPLPDAPGTAPHAKPRPAVLSRLDVGPPLLEGRTLPDPDAHRLPLEQPAPSLDPRRAHDVAPGPRTAQSLTQTSSIPRTPARADPEDSLEDLKATIMRSAQEALKQSEVHGF